MAAYNNFILTNQGIGLLADLMNGNGEMEFRCLAVGSGSYATEKNIEEIRGMENLKEERQRVMFSSIWKAENGFVNLKANLTNKDLDAGYPMTEAGIYVGKKGEQDEILYCVSTVDNPDYMPDYSSKQIYNVIFKMMISIGDVSNPTISYTTDMYALAEDLQEEVRRAAEAENKLDLRKLDKNGDASDTIVNFHPAESLEQLQSGKEQKDLFGQLAKAVADLITHLEDKLNPHNVTKEQVGLGNADDTSDMNKPVSTAQQAALDALYEQLTAYVLQKIADLIGGAPATLDTLKEIADAIATHKSVTDALDAAIGKKASAAEFDSHVKDTTKHITDTERTSWNAKMEKTGDASNATTAFSQATIRANLTSKEKLSVSLGKIMKWFADMANGAASTLLGANLADNRALVANANGKVGTSNVTSTELGYLSGVTSSVQNQIDELNTGMMKREIMAPYGYFGIEWNIDSLMALVRAGSWDKFAIGDYFIETTTTGEKIMWEVAGKNSYLHCGSEDNSQLLKNHIVCCPRDCLQTYYKFNSTNTNVGGYAASLMPANLEAEANKFSAKLRGYMTTILRLENNNGAWAWASRRIFLPGNPELVGFSGFADKFCGGAFNQLPLFVGGNAHLLKGAGFNKSKIGRINFWTADPSAANATSFCNFSRSGDSYENYASYDGGIAPLIVLS